MTCDFLQNSQGGIFNIGRGEVVTWNQLALALFDSLGKEANIQYVEMPPELSKQYQNYTCANMSKFHTLFPKMCAPIPESIREYVREYLMKSARW